MKTEDEEIMLSGFEDKPHRCPVCWRVDYNVLSFFGGRLVIGSCPDDKCWTKWWGLRKMGKLNRVTVQYKR